MPYETIELEVAGTIARVVLNRPEKRNAISHMMIAEILQALDEIEKGPARVLIITGADGYLGSGACTPFPSQLLRL